MCVINGIIDLSNQNDPNQLKTIIKKMNSSITSQGSEDDSLTTIDNIGLGFKHKELLNFESNERLIFSDDKSLALIFKGNIYNYKELKNDLILKGHVFKTNSDTEVVLHSYIEYGTSCFSYFSGVFALAVYDTRKKKTIIARDRAGEKSLYYHNSGQLFLFSSELKSLLISGKINKVISKKALNQYLQLTYIPALSIFENVFKVLPGHYIEIDSKGHTSSNQYWDVQYKKDNLIVTVQS